MSSDYNFGLSIFSTFVGETNFKEFEKTINKASPKQRKELLDMIRNYSDIHFKQHRKGNLEKENIIRKYEEIKSAPKKREGIIFKIYRQFQYLFGNKYDRKHTLIKIGQFGDKLSDELKKMPEV